MVLRAALMLCVVLLIVFAKPAKKAESADEKNGRPATGTAIYEAKPTT